MKTQESVKQLMRLPLHIVQKITRSSSRDKSGLVADFVFGNTEPHAIHFVQSEIDDNYVRIEWRGHKLGGIDVTRGKQDFTTHDMESHWSNEWDVFLQTLIDSMYTLDEQLAQQAQADYEDATDQAYTDDERDFIREFGDLADDILSQIGRTDTLTLVKDDSGNYRVCDEELDGKPIIESQKHTRLWIAHTKPITMDTPFPLDYLTDYVNRLNK